MLRIMTLMLLLVASTAQAFSHDAWDQLLQAHVHWQRDGVASTVDYAGMRTDESKLNAYLASLSKVNQNAFDDFSKNEKRAFLINAYNAFTVKLILKQPTLPDSIKDIGSLFSGPWDQRFFTLLDKKRTLDDVEQHLIRDNPAIMDPRMHFALNCASIGCPALRPHAYTSDKLDQQLDDSLRRFLSDRTRNRYDANDHTLEVSHIFDWYSDDFAKAAGSVDAFLARHGKALGLPSKARARLKAGKLSVDFLTYDWSLNKAGG